MHVLIEYMAEAREILSSLPALMYNIINIMFKYEEREDKCNDKAGGNLFIKKKSKN